jgi:serine/threonine protein kinase
MNDFQPKPFGKYFLIDKLATGGMAEIYKAKTFGVDGFEKLLAIKRILPHCSNDKEFINMLIDEAKLSVLLSHTNIAQVFDLGKVGTDYFISMEFVDGINLREVMNRCKDKEETLPDDISVYVVSEMCKGLDYAHSKKDLDGNPLHIVHRDISPQNILISYEGEVKVVDFGIAKAAMNISQTMAGVLKGKITYMSPEQALGKPVDNKTDIFSAGIILNELLTGQKFFTGETQFEVLKKIRSTRITESSFPETMAPELKKILAKALAYSAKDRFENAGDMQIELTKYLYSTYLDFSPRKLSNLMKRLFEREIESKKSKRRDELAIDASTRSILLEAEEQQNLVHREDIEKTSTDKAIQSTQSFQGAQKTDSTSMLVTPTPLGVSLPGKTIAQKILAPLTVFVLLIVLGLGGYLAYRRYLQPTSQGEKIGTMVINSIPAGAKVFLNDKDTNFLTPTTLQNVELNFSQKISLKKEKYAEWSRLVTLVSPQPLNIEATLESIPLGTIAVTTHPPGAEVFLDGKDLGIVTPTRIPDLELNKTYTLKVQKNDYQPVEDKITVYSIEPTQYEKKLEEIKYGSIEAQTLPSGAKIFLNNQDTQLLTPNKLTKLEVGKSYALKFSRDKYRDVVRNVEITTEKPVLISEKMISEEEIKKKEEEEKKKQQEKQAKLVEEQKKKETISPTTPEKPKPGGEQISKTPEAKKTEEIAPKKKEEVPTSGGPAFVALNSNPAGADVFINGERKGSTPGKFQVSAGSPVEITISKSGAGRISKVVTLKTGETRSLGTIDLGSEFGSLRIESEPPGATVVIDGQSTGRKTPIIVKGIRRGKEHSVTLQLDGYESWSRSFTMEEESKSFIANLKQK